MSEGGGTDGGACVLEEERRGLLTADGGRGRQATKADEMKREAEFMSGAPLLCLNPKGVAIHIRHFHKA